MISVPVTLTWVRENALADTKDNVAAKDVFSKPVPARIASTDSVAEQISLLTSSYNDNTNRGYFDEARRNVDEMLALARQHFDDDHYVVRRLRASSNWQNWFAALNDDQRSQYHNADDLAKEGVLLEGRGEYDAAVDKFRQASSALEKLNEHGNSE